MAGCGGGGAPVKRGCAAEGNGQQPHAGPLYGPPVEQLLPQSAGGGGVAIGDVTGDGRPDIVVGAHVPAVVVYPQTAAGGLGDPLIRPIEPTGLDQLFFVDLGDVNGDGRLDVVYSRTDNIGVMLGNASGGLDPEQRLIPSDPSLGTGAVVAVADLNDDGRSDVVSGGWLSGLVEVWFQDSAGRLLPPRRFACPHARLVTVAVGDVDGDGLTDVVFGSHQFQDLCVLLQRPGGFADGLSAPMGIPAGGVAIGNFGANDCAPSIAFSAGGNVPDSRLGITRMTAPGTFEAPTFHPAADIPESMTAADVDGDGRRDVIVMHTGWYIVSVFRSLATGGLAPEETYDFSNVFPGPDRVAIGDINGDGRPDLVAGGAFELLIMHGL
jgi:hypothetical protein